ncbi:MAG TPA: hypothetical protein VKD70_15480 [Candidatus Acidoferrum sp.]|nr:hypothetical protein [Candidatus Acidoferrum sp.]
MPFCSACGQNIEGSAYCPHCGAKQGGDASSPSLEGRNSPTAGIEENVAGLLCYAFLWVTGLIFLLLDKRPFVRFHAAQSIALCIAGAVLGAGFWVAFIFVTFVIAIVHIPIAFLIYLTWRVIWIGCFVAWISCMYKAYQHEKFKLPIIGDMVEKMVEA